MKKNTKRILTLVMAVLMLVALCTTAFADNDTTITVYVRVQTADSGTGYTQLANLTNVVDYTVYYGETMVTYDGLNYIAVSVPASSTVKDVVNALHYATIVNSCSCVPGGCTHTTYGCTCSSTSCTCTWKQVANVVWNGSAYVPDGTYSSALNSLNYAGTTRTNVASFPTSNSYVGDSWEYFIDGGYAIPDYMSQYVLSGGEHIALSYDHSAFSWP